VSLIRCNSSSLPLFPFSRKQFNDLYLTPWASTGGAWDEAPVSLWCTHRETAYSIHISVSLVVVRPARGNHHWVNEKMQNIKLRVKWVLVVYIYIYIYTCYSLNVYIYTHVIHLMNVPASYSLNESTCQLQKTTNSTSRTHDSFFLFWCRGWLFGWICSNVVWIRWNPNYKAFYRIRLCRNERSGS